MATLVVNVIPDPFNSQISQIRSDVNNGPPDQKNGIRRPTRGIVINQETFATLRVVKGTGEHVALVDAGSRAASGNTPLRVAGKRANDIYSNFLLQSATEERQEKAQVLETFGEAYIFLFGERARVINFSGILVNSEDFNWEAEWWYNYDNFLRGTRCVENNARVFLSYDNTLVSGYILNSAAAKSSQEKNWVNFSFQLFVTSYTTLTDVGNDRAGGGFVDEEVSAEELNSLRPRLISPDYSAILQGLALGSTGNVQAPKLIDGGYLNLSAIAQRTLDGVNILQNTIAKYGNLATKLTNNLLNGEVVRVPIGFAGSMVYDTSDASVVPVAVTGGTVRYTVYSDNEDEYVGKSGHGSYGSSFIGISKRSDAFLFKDVDVQAEYTKAKKQATTAATIWGNAGGTIPLQQVMGNLTAKVDPLKKLGLAVYTGIKTGNALVSVISANQNPSKSSSFDPNFNPDSHVTFRFLPNAKLPAGPDEAVGAGTKPHQTKPNKP